jgi:hypothetical protein
LKAIQKPITLAGARAAGANVISLIVRPTAEQPTSQDTIAALIELLARARCGDVIGLAFTAFMPDRRYYVARTGFAEQDPTLARGAVRALEDELAEIAHAEARAE